MQLARHKEEHSEQERIWIGPVENEPNKARNFAYETEFESK